MQEAPEFGPELDPDAILTALGLAGADAHADLPPQVVSTGLPHLLLPLAALDAVSRARPDFDAIASLFAEQHALTVYAFALAGERVRARAFTGSVAMGEDPATGSAAGPLGAYLAARLGAESVEIDQGVEMGRPSRLSVSSDGERPRVGGDVVLIAEGTLHV